MDIALIIDKNIQSQEVVSKVLDSNPKHIIVAECFDEFENDAKFGKNKKSIAIRIVYQNLDRTLTSQEAQKMHQAVGDLLKKTFNAEIRGSE